MVLLGSLGLHVWTVRLLRWSVCIYILRSTYMYVSVSVSGETSIYHPSGSPTGLVPSVHNESPTGNDI